MLPRTLFGKFNMAIISENNPRCSSKSKLDEAVVEERSVIVIKDSKLGNKIVLWIRIGCCLQKLTLVTAAGSIISATDIQDSVTRAAKPLAIVAVLLHVGYKLIWSPCPIMEYKVVQGPTMWSALKGKDYPSTILCKRSPSKRSSCLTIVACILATLGAFWNELKYLNPKELFNKVKSEIKDVTE